MRKVKLHIIVSLLFCVCSSLSAQLPYTDIPSVQALYHNHLEIYEELNGRYGKEWINQQIHDLVADEGKDYLDINTQLDRYTRLFDIIDILVRGLQTAMSATDTYNTITARVNDYRQLFEEYHEKILMQGRIIPEDTIIIVIGKATVDSFIRDCEQIYDSFRSLLMYCNPVTKLSCTTSDLMAIVSSVKYSLDKLSEDLNDSYSAMWRYMSIRMSYWKRDILMPRDKNEIAVGALQRWKSLCVHK